MKCLECGSEDMLAMISQPVIAKMAGSRGTIKLSGLTVTQLDIKKRWDEAEGTQIKGPIMCGVCDTPHYYVVGATNPLRKGDVTEARHVGHAALIKGD